MGSFPLAHRMTLSFRRGEECRDQSRAPSMRARIRAIGVLVHAAANAHWQLAASATHFCDCTVARMPQQLDLGPISRQQYAFDLGHLASRRTGAQCPGDLRRGSAGANRSEALERARDQAVCHLTTKTVAERKHGDRHCVALTNPVSPRIGDDVGVLRWWSCRRARLCSLASR